MKTNGMAGEYRRRTERRRWRIQAVKQAAEKHGWNLRRGLLFTLALETGILSWRQRPFAGYEFHLIRLEESYEFEWSEKDGKAFPDAADSERNPASHGNVYGIRLNPQKLEVEFYRYSAE